MLVRDEKKSLILIGVTRIMELARVDGLYKLAAGESGELFDLVGDI